MPLPHRPIHCYNVIIRKFLKMLREVTVMTPHGKKMLAPIIITVVFLLYLIVYGALVMMAALEEPLAVLLGIPLVLLGAGMVYTLFTRIREIRSVEEDDLDNY